MLWDFVMFVRQKKEINSIFWIDKLFNYFLILFTDTMSDSKTDLTENYLIDS